MTYTIKLTSRFQKDLKRIQRRGYDVSLLTNVIKKFFQYNSGIKTSRPTRFTGGGDLLYDIIDIKRTIVLKLKNYIWNFAQKKVYY